MEAQTGNLSSNSLIPVPLMQSLISIPAIRPVLLAIKVPFITPDVFGSRIAGRDTEGRIGCWSLALLYLSV